MKYLLSLLPALFCISFCFSQEKISPVDSVYEEVEVMPEYPGGINALLKYISQIKYPEYARYYEIEGIVKLSFVIDTNGNVTSIKFDKSSGTKVLDTAAYMHLKKMANWTPGLKEGKKVKVIFHIPIKFALQGEMNKKEKKISSDVLYNEGVRLFDIGEYKTAIILFDKAYFLNKKDIDSKFNSAVCKIMLERLDDACKDFKEIKNSGRLIEIKGKGSEKLIEELDSLCK
jgi:periplasmic protein TonB